MINFLILTKTSDEKKYNMTNELIQSIKSSIFPKNNSFSTYRILLIQTHKTNFKYQEQTLEILNSPFNYNYCLNKGISHILSKYTQNDWFCFMNNDLICEKNWINEISKIYDLDNTIQSFSPNTNAILSQYEYGYTLHKHLKGYCFMCNKSTIEKIGLFDQLFDFYFQDDDYLEQLRNHNIKHCCVKKSNVYHIGSQTINVTNNIQNLINSRNKFISKYSVELYQEREKEKGKVIVYNNQKIGIGIITYNRPEKFNNLINIIKDIDYIDYIIIIKDKNIDYGQYNPENFVNDKIKYINLQQSKCIAQNKNVALKEMLKNGCGHLFLIQDDILIKDIEVFRKYIQTAKAFKIEHLNFCRRWMPEKQKYQTPTYCINFKDNGLEFYEHLCGLFSYFTSNAINTVGYFDEKYINALEHGEHTFRLSLNNMYIPKFHMFADIKDSNKYLEDLGKETTISNNDKYKENLLNALNYFQESYKIHIAKLPRPTLEELQQFYINKIKNK